MYMNNRLYSGMTRRLPLLFLARNKRALGIARTIESPQNRTFVASCLGVTRLDLGTCLHPEHLCQVALYTISVSVGGLDWV